MINAVLVCCFNELQNHKIIQVEGTSGRL